MTIKSRTQCECHGCRYQEPCDAIVDFDIVLDWKRLAFETPDTEKWFLDGKPVWVCVNCGKVVKRRIRRTKKQIKQDALIAELETKHHA